MWVFRNGATHNNCCFRLVFKHTEAPTTHVLKAPVLLLWARLLISRDSEPARASTHLHYIILVRRSSSPVANDQHTIPAALNLYYLSVVGSIMPAGQMLLLKSIVEVGYFIGGVEATSNSWILFGHLFSSRGMHAYRCEMSSQAPKTLDITLTCSSNI